MTAAPGTGLRSRAAAIRAHARSTAVGRTLWRLGVGLTGGIVVVIGVVLLPLPGPGWLIIFTGLAIWATEFAWAARLLGFAKVWVGRWVAWLRRQARWVHVLVGAAGLALTGSVLYLSWLVF